MKNQNVLDIVRAMTLQEKAALCAGSDFWHIPGVPRLGIEPAMVADGPHGLRKQRDGEDCTGVNDSIEAVCFPAGCATACSFDPVLMHRMGSALGQECNAENVDILLGPAVNIKRSPLCGRNFEYYSEDPFLTGKMAGAFIEGVQEKGVGTSLKHFAANNQEFRRMSVSAQIEEQALREIYLAGFEMAVKQSKPWTLMSSYNRINGVYSSENEWLLTKVLREQWGFDGFVISDWGAVNNKIESLLAGLEVEMPGPCEVNTKKVLEAVQNGQLPEEVLDRAVRRILSVLLRREKPKKIAAFDRKADHAFAVKVAEQSAVLLKNENILPLDRNAKIAYIGEFAVSPRYQGGGSSHIRASDISNAVGCAPGQVVYSPGFPSKGDQTTEEAMQHAVLSACQADIAVIFAGLPEEYECEGYDRPHMRLPECQNELIRRIAEVQPNTVVVLHVGSPVETPWADQVSGILCMYLAGEGVGEAETALLYGDVVPSGRLAESWPIRIEDTPSYLDFGRDEDTARYSEGIFVGYRYYEKKKMAVRWPFGHGESYTRFEYSQADAHVENSKIVATVKVRNAGKKAAAEVVQLYVSNQTGLQNRPEKELKGFSKVFLESGEEKVVTFELSHRDLAGYNVRTKSWYAPSGRYGIIFAHSSEDIRETVYVDWTSSDHNPLEVDRNTVVAELYRYPRAKELLAPYLIREDDVSDTARQAITPEMQRHLVLNTPLRNLQQRADNSEEWLETLIRELQLIVDSGE